MTLNVYEKGFEHVIWIKIQYFRFCGVDTVWTALRHLQLVKKTYTLVMKNCTQFELCLVLSSIWFV